MASPRRSWAFADLFGHIAARQPDAPAQRHGKEVVSWAELVQRSRRIASALRRAGLVPGDKVAQYLLNGPAYLQSVLGCFYGQFVPVNTNYRYVDAELAYLWENSDTAAIVFDTAFAERLAALRPRLDLVRTLIGVGPIGECPSWATPLAEISGDASLDQLDATGSGTDLVLLYTGGTTGRPKGVMWEQDTLCRVLSPMSGVPIDDATTLDGFVDAVLAAERPVTLPACPLMHGTGLFTALASLIGGGSVVTLTEASFDVTELLETIEREQVTHLTVVGDAFARPIVDALDKRPHDITSLKVVISSGVMFSAPVKQRLLDHHAGGLLILDSLGSSEGMGMGASVSHAGEVRDTATFSPTATSVVVKDDGSLAGPGETGRLGTRGLVPVGYYKDPEHTASTFPTIDGIRHSLPGDYAEVQTDGSYRLLGRGSACINTGGEKVYPEEVEEVLKKLPGIADAIVVGVPDERLGSIVVGLAQAQPGATIDTAEVQSSLRAELAGYKCPRHLFVVESVDRAVNGKVDHRSAGERARHLLAQLVP